MRYLALLVLFIWFSPGSLLAQEHLNKYIPKPDAIKATGYDSHVELRWPDIKGAENYRVYLKLNDGNELRAETENNFLIDFINDKGRNITVRYSVVPLDSKGRELAKKAMETEASIRDFSDEELVDMVERYTLRYFWEFGHEELGMARERDLHKKGDILTTGGTGFGVMAIIAGTDRGWISREEAVERLMNLVRFLQSTDRFHGMWSHWYDAETKKTYGFSEYDDGGDIVESSFLIQGLLAARQYFDGNGPEKELCTIITELWESMEWDFYTRGEKVLYWHWSPTHGWKMKHPIKGYNESLITYILAAASPSHPIDPEAYHEGWANWEWETFGNYSTYYGIMLPLGNRRHLGGPLFFAHYSYLGLDPRGLSDRYACYWEQNVRHTLVNRAYCIDNPMGWKGYGEDFWGLTAGDMVPEGYTAHAPGYRRDFGTITPTAALSSIPYTPRESIAVIKNLYRNYGKYIFGPFGFYDGINLTVGDTYEEHVRKTYIAIDQGPIVVMMENYRTGLLWKYFMKDKDVLRGLHRLGFMINNRPVETGE